MTVSEMHQAFKIGLDKIDSLNYPNFEPSEIDFLLNQAQDSFVKQRYGFNNNKLRPFESDQKRIDDLRMLIKNVIIPINTYDSLLNIDINARFVVLPDDYWFLVNERATVEYNDCNSNTTQKIASIRPCNHDDFSMVIDNPFEKPTKDKLIRLFYENYIELIHAPNTSILDYKLRYIKRPVKIDIFNNIDCELAEHTHQEICNGAILIGLETIESKRTQSFLSIEKNNEE
jgi:hypothetical protein